MIYYKTNEKLVNFKLFFSQTKVNCLSIPDSGEVSKGHELEDD